MKIEGWLLIVILLVALGIAGRCDYQDAVAEDARYQANVALWKADAAAGIPEYARHGWPEYRK